MPRLPEFNPARPQDAAQAKHHFDEYESGLDRTGPQFAEDEEQEAAVRAAGVSAYYPTEEMQ